MLNRLKSCEHFAEAGRLRIYACGRIIQNSMSDQRLLDYKLDMFLLWSIAITSMKVEVVQQKQKSVIDIKIRSE